MLAEIGSLCFCLRRFEQDSPIEIVVSKQILRRLYRLYSGCELGNENEFVIEEYDVKIKAIFT